MGMPIPAPPDPRRRWTADEVRTLYDASSAWPRYELIDGALLVSPAPSWLHQRAVARLWRALDDYVRAESIGEAVISPADLELEPGNVTQPDVFVVSASERRRPARWDDVRRLLVAAEVLSPSTARHDRLTKRRYYQRQQVPEYWVVDVDARLVERWRLDDAFRPEGLDASLTWQPHGAAAAFTLDLAAYFANVHDEAAGDVDQAGGADR
jgi:Uma2 family endonuclease